MAFDGPGPFDGDPVSNYLDRVSNRPPAVVQDELAAAFREVLEGGASRRMPDDLANMLGIDPSSIPSMYLDVDEAVWAWACAEMVAVALGHEPETPIPGPFYAAAQSLPDPRMLVADALKAIDIIGDTARSELAGLLEEAQAEESSKRIASLRTTLQHWQLRPV